MDNVRDLFARDQIAQARPVRQIVDHLRGNSRPRIKTDRVAAGGREPRHDHPADKPA